MAEDFKQELPTVEKQIAEKLAEIRVFKQYSKSMEIAMRLKQKLEDNQQAHQHWQERKSRNPGHKICLNTYNKYVE